MVRAHESPIHVLCWESCWVCVASEWVSLVDIYFSRPCGALVPLWELERDVRTMGCPVAFSACTGLGGVPRPGRIGADLPVRDGLDGFRRGGL